VFLIHYYVPEEDTREEEEMDEEEEFQFQEKIMFPSPKVSMSRDEADIPIIVHR
jgi:hypothetical protein